MKEAYQACIKVCAVCKYIFAVPEKRRKNMKNRNGFLYGQNLNKQWTLVMPSAYNAGGKNFLEIEIAEAYAATAHAGIVKTIQHQTDMLKWQSCSRRISECVGSCNIYHRMQYLQRGSIGYVTPLHVPVRPWRDITMDFLKLSPVFTKCSVLYPNFPVGEDHMVCISQLWTIVDRQLVF